MEIFISIDCRIQCTTLTISRNKATSSHLTALTFFQRKTNTRFASSESGRWCSRNIFNFSLNLSDFFGCYKQLKSWCGSFSSFFISEFLNWILSNDGQNHCPYSVFGWSRRLCEVRVHTPTSGLQVKPHLPWCFLTHWLVGRLVVALKLTADICSSSPPLDYLHSSPL